MRTKPGEISWVWFDEVGIINWDALEEGLTELAIYGQTAWFIADKSSMLKEEKPVKQIDFSKPVVIKGTPERSPVKVVQEGMTLVRVENDTARVTNRTWYAVIDENGKTHGTFEPNWAGAGVCFENVPVDTLIVYQGYDGDFRIDGGGDDQRYSRSQAERITANTRFYRNAVLVKVPV